MIKRGEKLDKINEKIELFERILEALKKLRDEDVAESAVLRDLNIHQPTFRRVVYSTDWSVRDGFNDPDFCKRRFSDMIPTKNWAEDLFCDVMGLKNNPQSIDKIPSDVLETMEEVVKTLTERERRLIDLRYKHGFSKEMIAKEFNVSNERIRQIENKIYRKLRNPRRLAYIAFGEDFYINAKAQRIRLEKDYDIKVKLRELDNLNRQILVRKNITNKKVLGIYNKDTNISELGLSIRCFNCLNRAAIETLGDLCDLTRKEVMEIRNLGRKCFDEINDIMAANGLFFKEEK